MISLEAQNGVACLRTKNAVDRPIIIALLGQGLLHLRSDIARGELAKAVDGAIIDIVVVVRTVAPRREPPAGVPKPIAAAVEDDDGVMMPPPIPVMIIVRASRARLGEGEFVSSACRQPCSATQVIGGNALIRCHSSWLIAAIDCLAGVIPRHRAVPV